MTSYIINKWNEGEVHFRSGAVGWIVAGEFRPLMSDAMQELHTAGCVDDACVLSTLTAREAYVEQSLAEYRTAQQNRTPEEIAEQRFESRAAMGPGVEMVNIITGETYTT